MAREIDLEILGKCVLESYENTRESNIGFIIESREAVYKALKEMKGWNTHLDVRDFGIKYIDAPKSRIIVGHGSRGGGWKVWQFTDRVLRHLFSLVGKGFAVSKIIIDEKNKKITIFKAV